MIFFYFFKSEKCEENLFRIDNKKKTKLSNFLRKRFYHSESARDTSLDKMCNSFRLLTYVDLEHRCQTFEDFIETSNQIVPSRRHAGKLMI